MELNEIIKSECYKQNMNLVTLAEKMGISKQCLSNKFLRKNFFYRDIEMICEILNIKIEFHNSDGILL